MEPTGHSDNDQRTPLRTSSPRAPYRAHNNASPLRASKSRSPTNQPTISEDQSYEQRRQDELRRQIRLKEQELQQISSTKERFKNRIERTLGLNNSIPDLANSQNKSPLRASVTSKERPSAFQTHDQEQFTPMVAENPRSTSPLRKHNKSQEREPTNFTTQGPRYLDRGASDYTQQLMADNQQLQRRLNLVVAELDRVTREKHLQEQRLQSAATETEGLQRAIEDEEHTDKHLHGLQMEVTDHRETNKRAGLDIQRADTIRQESVHQLRMLQAERERRIQDCDDIRRNLQTKAQLLAQMDREQRLHQERIHDLNDQIAKLQRQENEDSHTLHDLDLVIVRLNRERDELMGKLDSLNRNYDNTVAEISRERAQLESHNKRHSQLLTSKALGNLLSSMVLARKQAALNEFFSYCKFDERCHSTLSSFVQVLQRCGHYQMRIGMKRWYQEAFKPIATQTQSAQLASKLHATHLKQRMFQQWRAKIAGNSEAGGSQSMAVKQIWKIRQADAKKDVARAFRIWRDQQSLGRQQEKSLRFLLMRQYHCKKRQALHRWAHHSLDIGGAVRMHILAHSFTQDQLKLITFHQLRFKCAQHRRVRLMKLRRLLQGWRAANAYRKFMMAQCVNTGSLRHTLNSSLMEACFAALRLNKEQEKYDLMRSQLQEDMDPAIARLLQDIEHGSKEELKQRKQHALATLSKLTTVKMGSYFYGWRDWKEDRDVRLDKNLREVITRLCQTKLAAAFDLWRIGRDHKARVVQQNTLGDLNSENTGLNDANVDLGQQLDKEQSRQDRRSRGGLTRGCNIFARRMQKYGLRRWLEKVHMLQDKESGAAKLILKFRRKRERVAFDRYLAGIHILRQDAKNEERAIFFAETMKMRRQRNIYNAWCVFVHKFGKSKQYWNIVLTKMDLWMKRRAFTNWQNQGNVKVLQYLEMDQNDQVEVFDNLNKDLRNRQNRKADKSGHNDQLKADQRRQGERILANTYARMYYSRLQKAFNKWDTVVDCQRHRETVIKRTELHYKKHVMYFVRASFHLWSSKAKVNELNADITHTNMLGDEAAQMNEHKRGIFEENKKALEDESAKTDAEADVLAQKGERTIALLIKKNDDNHYQSYRRYVFVQWATFVKKQKAFILAIEKVVTKSIQQDGFSNINAFSRDKHLTREQNRGLVGMRRLFFRKTVGEHFSRWKSWRMESTRQAIAETNTETEQIQDVHAKKVRKIRDWNCDRSNKTFSRRTLHNTWQAWRNVTRWQKNARVATENFKEHKEHYHQIRAVRKWHERAEHTRKCRDRTEKFHAFKKHLILKAVYGAIKDRFVIEKNFAWRLKEIAFKFDSKNKQCAMQMVRNFANSRQYMHERQRRHAATDLASALSAMFDRKRIEAISDFRTAFQDHKSKASVMSSVLGHWYSRSTREMFERWKKQAQLCNVAIECNEAGPVVEEVLKARQDFENLQNFMREQGYRENEVKDSVEMSKERVKEQLERTRARWLAFGGGDDDYLKPKMFDRWRQFVKMRKMVGHTLNMMENRLQPVKADLSIMFNRWKYTTGRSLEFLSGEERKDLQDKCAANVRKLGQLEDRTAETEDYLAHMGMQRDELIDNYMKSQKLAVALCRDNRMRTQACALNKLKESQHNKKRAEFEEMLQRNIEFIATVKDKIRQFEDDNQSLAGENEELRQFSLDGYQIAKNVQSLGNEREKLSVDLADKANTIKKLLDENESLSMNLRDAQDNAQRLINQSQQNMRSMGRPQMV